MPGPKSRSGAALRRLKRFRAWHSSAAWLVSARSEEERGAEFFADCTTVKAGTIGTAGRANPHKGRARSRRAPGMLQTVELGREIPCRVRREGFEKHSPRSEQGR